MPYKDPEKARESARKRGKTWREKHPGRANEVRRASYQRHADKSRAASREWYHANKERVLKRLRIHHLMKFYGLTVEAYAALGSACAICGASEDNRTQASTKKPFRLAVDHDHDTKRVRGLLCGNCNCGIGYLKHDAVLMAKAIQYLQKHQ